MVAATTFLTCAACANPATPGSQRWTVTGGGKHPRSTPTKNADFCRNARKHVLPQRCSIKSCSRLTAHPGASGLGLGPSDLYSLVRGQRAGPTVCKVPESNKVLTLRASSAVPVRGEIPLSVARFSCVLSVRIWVCQGRTGEGGKLWSFSSGVLDPSLSGVRLS